MAAVGLLGLLLLLSLLAIYILRKKKRKEADKEMPLPPEPIIPRMDNTEKGDIRASQTPDFSLHYLEYSFGSNDDGIIKGEVDEPVEENF